MFRPPGKIHEDATAEIRERMHDDQLVIYFDPALKRFVVADGREFELVVETREGKFIDASHNHNYIVRRIQECDLARRRLVKRDIGRNRVLTLQ